MLRMNDLQEPFTFTFCNFLYFGFFIRPQNRYFSQRTIDSDVIHRFFVIVFGDGRRQHHWEHGAPFCPNQIIDHCLDATIVKSGGFFSFFLFIIQKLSFCLTLHQIYFFVISFYEFRVFHYRFLTFFLIFLLFFLRKKCIFSTLLQLKCF